jgi:O-antigen/teichoic acid export membrane protein
MLSTGRTADRHVVVTKNIVLLVASTTISKLSAMAVAVVMARLLGVEHFGLYAFALALANLLSLLPNFGFDPLVSRDVAKDSSLAGQFLGDIVVLKVALSAVTLLIVAAIIALTSFDPTRQTVIALAVGIMLVESFLNFFSSFYRAYQVLEYEAVVQIALALFHTAVGLLVLYLGYGLIPFLLWRLIGFVGGTAIAYHLLAAKLVRPVFSLRVSALRELLRRALPLAIVSLFVATYVRIDMVLLSLMRGDLATGWYSAAQRPVGIFAFLPAAFVGAILPAMSRMGHTTSDLSQYCEQMIKYLLILALPLAIGLGLLADKAIVLLYGRAYAPAIPALQILAWSLAVTFVNHGLSTALMAVGEEKRFMAITGWGAAFNLGTNLVFIPLLGHVGASLTTLASELFVLVLAYRQARRSLQNLRLRSVVYKPILAGLGLGGVILSLHSHNLFTLVGIGAVSYVGALLLFGALRRQDLILPIRSVLVVFRG